MGNFFRIDLVHRREKNGGVFEFPAKNIQSFLLKVRSTPKHQSNAFFLMAVA